MKTTQRQMNEVMEILEKMNHGFHLADEALELLDGRAVQIICQHLDAARKHFDVAYAVSNARVENYEEIDYLEKHYTDKQVYPLPEEKFAAKMRLLATDFSTNEGADPADFLQQVCDLMVEMLP